MSFHWNLPNVVALLLTTAITHGHSPVAAAPLLQNANSVWQGMFSRGLQAVPASLSPERLRELKVPPNADILFQLQSDCPEIVPSAVRARMTSLCNVVNNTRQCLDMTHSDPQFFFKNCSRASKGCEPIMHTNEETVCIFSGLGIDVSGKNKSLETRYTLHHFVGF